jgi:hypothetical protein
LDRDEVIRADWQLRALCDESRPCDLIGALDRAIDLDGQPLGVRKCERARAAFSSAVRRVISCSR